jgi:hypothetical protein
MVELPEVKFEVQSNATQALSPNELADFTGKLCKKRRI